MHRSAAAASGTPGAILGSAAVLAILGMALLQPLPPRRPATPITAGAPVPAAGQSWQQVRPCNLDPPGGVSGRLYGAIDTSIQWAGGGRIGFRCDGMVRPGGGVRLFFAGPLPGIGPLLLVIGIDGTPGDLAGREAPANVTLIDESAGRFYASSGAGRCWVAVTGTHPLPPREAPGWRIEGTLYCAGSLPALHDRSAVTPGEIHFAGRVSGNAPEGEAHP